MPYLLVLLIKFIYVCIIQQVKHNRKHDNMIHLLDKIVH